MTYKDFGEKLFKEKNVALVMHMRPDGDTIGSSLALALALKSKGVETQVFCSDVMPPKFCYLQDINDVKTQLNGSEFSAIVTVDCASNTRLGDCYNEYVSHKNTYNIDHHVSNERYAKFNLVEDNSSNCENVYKLIKEMGVTVTQRMANLLATGVITDTGCFAHKNVTANTLSTATELLKAGADFNEIIYYTFKARTKESAKLYSTVTSKIKFYLDNKFGVVSIFRKDIEECGARVEDTEGIIDFVMGIICVQVGASILELGENKYKISFRSKGPDVNAVAGTFGGGGHILASGCQINACYEEVVDKITFAVSRYIPD